MAFNDVWTFFVANKKHLLHLLSLFMISSGILFFKLDNNVAGTVVEILDLNGGLNTASMWNHNAAVGIYALSLFMVGFAVFYQRRYRIFDTNVVVPPQDAVKQSDEEEEED